MVNVKEDLTGKIFKNWKVVDRGPDRIGVGKVEPSWICECLDCSRHREFCQSTIKQGRFAPCNHKWVESGRRYGKLVVLNEAEDFIDSKGKHRSAWTCQCDCGNIKKIRQNDLISGKVKSCGCIQSEKFKSFNSSFKKKINTYDLDSQEYGIGYDCNGERFIFDKTDYELIKDYCWYVTKHGYVATTEHNDGHTHTIFIHKLIMGVIESYSGTFCDHINGNKLDNRRCNLRLVTKQQNCMNKKVYEACQSGYVGVYKSGNKWYARLTYNGKHHGSGALNTLEEAIEARRQLENTYFGDYSRNSSLEIYNKNLSEVDANV